MTPAVSVNTNNDNSTAYSIHTFRRRTAIIDRIPPHPNNPTDGHTHSTSGDQKSTTFSFCCHQRSLHTQREEQPDAPHREHNPLKSRLNQCNQCDDDGCQPENQQYAIEYVKPCAWTLRWGC